MKQAQETLKKIEVEGVSGGNAIKVIINEYLKVSDFFLENPQKKYLNAILDKISKKSRIASQ